MFPQPKVECFLNNVSLTGKGDKKVVRFNFYITPITHYLTAQISPEVAAVLFHDDGSGDMKPALIMPTASLDIGKISLQKMALHPSDDPKMEKHGAMLDRVQLSHLNVSKLFPDDPNFSLIFRAEAPLDKLAIELGQKYFQEKLFITFTSMQGEMFPKALNKCEYCDDPPVAKDSEGALLCQKDVKKGKGEIDWLLKRETPAQADARAKKEATEKSKAAAADKDDEKRDDDDDKSDNSHANKPKGGKTSRTKKAR